MSGFIEDPANTFAAVANFTRYGPLRNVVSQETITLRLTQFMNTYWAVPVGEQLTTGSDDSYADAVNLTRGFGTSSDTSTRTNITANAPATIGTSEEILHCEVSWLSILTITTLIGLIASASGPVLVVVSNGPRLSVNISTMVRDNRYCGAEVDFAGSSNDDNERSKLLANIGVRMGDVKPHESIGHVASSTSRVETIGKLEKDRLYD